jgi:hypothetical protein
MADEGKKKMSKKKKKKELPHTRGLLDWIDIILGRFSDSDSSQPGKRKRSWGATIMFWCMIPAFTLVFAKSFQLVYSTIKTPTVSISKNVKKATPKGRKGRPVKVPTASSAKSIIDWPIVSLAGLILLVGVAYSLLRRQQDLDRAIKLGRMVSEVKHGIAPDGTSNGSSVSAETSSFLENTLKTVVGQVTGSAPPPDPKVEMVDEWAERAKQAQPGGAS